MATQPSTGTTLTTATMGPGGAASSEAGRCPTWFLLGPSSGAIRCDRQAGHDVVWHRSERHRFEWNDTGLWPLPVGAFISRAVPTCAHRTSEREGCPPDGGRSRRGAHAA